MFFVPYVPRVFQEVRIYCFTTTYFTCYDTLKQILITELHDLPTLNTSQSFTFAHIFKLKNRQAVNGRTLPDEGLNINTKCRICFQPNLKNWPGKILLILEYARFVN